jgi:hypothetical protein
MLSEWLSIVTVELDLPCPYSHTASPLRRHIWTTGSFIKSDKDNSFPTKYDSRTI